MQMQLILIKIHNLPKSYRLFINFILLLEIRQISLTFIGYDIYILRK